MKRALIFSMFTAVVTLSCVPIGFALYHSATPWSTYRHDAARSGATLSGVPDDNSTLWTYGSSTYGLVVVSTPIVVSGRVIFQVNDWAYGVDETTGVKLWEYHASGQLTAPGYADGRVFFGISSSAGGIACVNASAGTEIWKYDLSPNFVEGSPVVHAGVVCVGTTDNYVRAFNATNGHYKWGYKADGPIYSSPAVDGDMLFFGSNDTKLYALDISGLTPVSEWNFTANGAIRSTPSIDGGRVFFGTDSHMLFALDETTGAQIWSWNITNSAVKIRNSVSVANDIVYVTSTDSASIYALHADAAPGNYTETDFDIRYWTKTMSGSFNEPVYANGKLLVTTQGVDPAWLYVLDADIGTTLWSRHVNWWPSIGNPVVADGRVWFSAYWWEPGSHTLYCIGDPFPPSTDYYRINAGGETFDVALETNSTITNFDPTDIETLGKISFNAKGIGTCSMCNITIPNNMLDGSLNVTVDGGQPLYSAPPLNNGTHTSLYFTYNNTMQHLVEITGTTYIPEYPTALILPLGAAALALIAVKPKRISKSR